MILFRYNLAFIDLQMYCRIKEELQYGPVINFFFLIGKQSHTDDISKLFLISVHEYSLAFFLY